MNLGLILALIAIYMLALLVFFDEDAPRLGWALPWVPVSIALYLLLFLSVNAARLKSTRVDVSMSESGAWR